MALNIRDFGSISANAGPIPVFFRLIVGGVVGVNRGAQFAQGNPQSSGADLVSTNHSIILNGNETTYRFDLRNRGNQPTSFTLAEGGLI